MCKFAVMVNEKLSTTTVHDLVQLATVHIISWTAVNRAIVNETVGVLL